MTGLAPTIPPPWISIWRHPRATIRSILSGQAHSLSWLALAAVSGVAQTLVRGEQNNIGARAPLLWILVAAVLIGVVWGVVQLHVLTASLYLVGRWSGDKATFRDLRMAIAWSQVPQVVVFASWLIAAVFLGRGVFRVAESLGPGEVLIAFALFALSLVTLVCVVWSLVILVNGLAEAQRISGAMAVFHLIGAGLMLGVAALVFVVPLVLLMAK